jgi:hypothetical protein
MIALLDAGKTIPILKKRFLAAVRRAGQESDEKLLQPDIPACFVKAHHRTPSKPLKGRALMPALTTVGADYFCTAGCLKVFLARLR